MLQKRSNSSHNRFEVTFHLVLPNHDYLEPCILKGADMASIAKHVPPKLLGPVFHVRLWLAPAGIITGRTAVPKATVHENH
jgi:hypothetical protein